MTFKKPSIRYKNGKPVGAGPHTTASGSVSYEFLCGCCREPLETEKEFAHDLCLVCQVYECRPATGVKGCKKGQMALARRVTKILTG